MSRVGAMALFPGAGSSREHSSLVAIESALAPLPVGRFDFDYRRAGRRAPDRAAVLLARVRTEAAAMAREAHVRPDRVVLGGRSMGGRMCSMAVAGVPDVDGIAPIRARGLVLISYPLHPPGKPDRLRVEHLPRLDVPCLFIHGSKDPFGTPDELGEHLAVIPGAVTLVVIDGGRHDLARQDARIADEVAAWVGALR